MSTNDVEKMSLEEMKALSKVTVVLTDEELKEEFDKFRNSNAETTADDSRKKVDLSNEEIQEIFNTFKR